MPIVASVNAAVRVFPSLEVDTVVKSAREYVRTRNPKNQREIFRLLKAAMERLRFQSDKLCIHCVQIRNDERQTRYC